MAEASATDYVVVASQLNRAIKLDDGTEELVSIRRGENLPDDTSAAELQRWLALTPAVIKTQDELDQARGTYADQSATIADLQAQLAEANAKLAEAEAAGGAHEPAAGLEEPAGNASVDAWRDYAKSVDPANAEAIDAASRDELRDKYKSA
jgi:hypothetical protein